MRVINIAIFVFALGATLLTVRNFAGNRSSIRATVLWMLIWSAIGIFGLFPALLDFLMSLTMMQNRLVFLFVIAILVLYALFYNQNNRNLLAERRVARLAQELALLRFQQTYGGSSGEPRSSETPSDAEPRPPIRKSQ